MEVDLCGPVVPAEDGGVSFRAKVDGSTVACRFSWEALQDIDPDLKDLSSLEQFEANIGQLLEVAEKKIRNGGVVDGVVLIETDDVNPV